MNETLVALIIGIVEGLTEFLPVSSTGHMILVGSILGFEGVKASTFEVFIQLGAILSVIFLYHDKFIYLISPKRWNSRYRLSWQHISVGILPIMVVGYLLHKPIKEFLFSPLTVIIGLVLGAVFMLAAEKITKRSSVRNVDEISVQKAFLVGLFQILALWPGFSRSGSTIAGGLLLGINRAVAAEFSFIIAVPLMMVACIYDLMKIWNQLSISDLQTFAIGFCVAFGVAYVSIIWFVRFLNKSTLASFAYYRFILAGISYYYFML